MPDYNSRKKLEKKVIDRWENEGGNHSPYEGKLKTVNLPCKGKQTKNRHRQAANKNENL